MTNETTTITLTISAEQRGILYMANLQGKDPAKAEEFAQSVDLALGLGGWDTDPADPFKRPYSPENAAIAGMARHWSGKDEEEARTVRNLIAAIVEEIRDTDAQAIGPDPEEEPADPKENDQ